VSIKAQILNLLQDLQEEFGLTILLISHNLNVVKHFCNRIAVMYLGQLIEIAECDELFSNLKHPYTEALISSIPTVDPRIKTNRIVLTGEVPTATNPPPGCRFSTRCQYSKPICSKEEPILTDIGSGHLVACHFWDSLSLQSFQI
jgi:oligopeptide/dipeptide ABC transporter ATP-binding protein